MARVGASVTKSVSFRGVQQEFTNVYHYTGGTWDVSAATSLLDQIKAAEVPLHSPDVSFLRGAVWTSDGGPSSNNMLLQKNYSGVGSGVGITTMDRERAFLIQWAAGTDSRGHKVYLRKWYHSCGLPTGTTGMADTVLQQTTALSSNVKGIVEGLANVLASVTVSSVQRDLCSAGGRIKTAAGVCHPWLEHHQLGDMWR